MGAIEPSRLARGRAMLLAGPRRPHAFDAAARDIPAQWEELHRLRPLPGELGTTTYGVICGAAPDRRTFEYMCAIEVAAFDPIPAGVGRLRVPEQRYAVFTHDAHVSALGATWEAIWSDWLPRSGLRPADTPDFERYDERYDPATGRGGIEIWFPIREDGGGAPA